MNLRNHNAFYCCCVYKLYFLNISTFPSFILAILEEKSLSVEPLQLTEMHLWQIRQYGSYFIFLSSRKKMYVVRFFL